MQQGRCIPRRLAMLASGLLLATAAHAQSAEDGWDWGLTFKQLEWQESATPEALMWDAHFWVGTAQNRLWIRDEGGRHVSGARNDNRLEVLWGHELRRWEWMDRLKLEMLLGVRHDSGTTPTRTYGAIGFQALLPHDIRFEASGFVGDGSHMGDDLHAGLRLQAERDWNISERWSVALRAEYEVWSEDHVRYSEGHGPWMSSAGLRLRFRIHDGVAPYVGVEWFDLVQDTAAQAVAAGEAENEVRAVVGLRMQFGSR